MRKRGKFDFDHHFAFLTIILKKDRTFCLAASFLKPPKKGTILQSERGVNSILITILRFDHLPEG